MPTHASRAQNTVKASASCKVETISPDWLLECKNRGTMIPPDAFKLPPLHGLNVCITGFVLESEICAREAMPGHISSLGGTYLKDMHKGQCTHLIAHSAQGAKYTWVHSPLAVDS